jgi:hypothetical protein
MPQIYRRTKHFSSRSNFLIDQLKSCDEAGIATMEVDENLDFNWGIDATRRLKDWDIPGYLSAVACKVLQDLGNHYAEQYPPAKERKRWSMMYLAVISGESDHNDTWRSHFDCDDWTVLMVPRTVAGVGIYTRTLKDDSTVVSIPFHAEGFSAHLIVQVFKVACTSPFQLHPHPEKSLDYVANAPKPFYLA